MWPFGRQHKHTLLCEPAHTYIQISTVSRRLPTEIHPVKYTVFYPGRAERMKSLLTQHSYHHHMMGWNRAESSRAPIVPPMFIVGPVSGPLLNISLSTTPLPVQWLLDVTNRKAFADGLRPLLVTKPLQSCSNAANLVVRRCVLPGLR